MNSLTDLAQLIAQNIWLYGGTFVLVLSLLVFVHEWGHYIIARLCGVRVETFSIGFGKEIWGINDKHGTRWKVSLVPLGGYVKMFGDVDPASARHTEETKDEKGDVRPLTEEERSVAFFSKNVWARSAIVFAGPAINFLFAIVILCGLYTFYGQPVTPPLATAIIEGSAADKAGFLPHDEVLTINGRKARRFEDLRREAVIALDTEMTMEVLRDGKVIEIRATPSKMESEDHHGFKSSRGMLGILGPGNGLHIESIEAVDEVEYEDADALREALLAKMGQTFRIKLNRGFLTDNITVHPLPEMNKGLKDPDSPAYFALVLTDRSAEHFVKHGPVDAFVAAMQETAAVTLSTLHALGQMVSGTRSATELGGVIRIGAMAGDMAQTGIIALITFTALLSINLGLINLFPIPMLDGGHLLFYFVEMVKGSPISDQIQEYAFRLGLAILVGIMLFANLNDIVQLIL